MSDTATVPDQSTEVVPAADDTAPLFSQEELRAFDSDDTEAGRNICKMLSLFFFYTVIVMGISAWITYSWVN